MRTLLFLPIVLAVYVANVSAACAQEFPTTTTAQELIDPVSVCPDGYPKACGMECGCPTYAANQEWFHLNAPATLTTGENAFHVRPNLTWDNCIPIPRMCPQPSYGFTYKRLPGTNQYETDGFPGFGPLERTCDKESAKWSDPESVWTCNYSEDDYEYLFSSPVPQYDS